MPDVTVIGGRGFVGSAFVRALGERHGVRVRSITRDNYEELKGTGSDIVIDAAGNSKKFIAEQEPFRDFELSVAHRLRTLMDFPAGTHVHVSSADVYSGLESPATTNEGSPIDMARSSNYGFHKRMAEQLVQRYAQQWLIVRLAGMVGPGLRKNPVYDILTGAELRIHPESRYQFIATETAADVTWRLVEGGVRNEVYNICGRGLVSPREIAAIAGRPLRVAAEAASSAPRIVDIDIQKIERRWPMPESKAVIEKFVAQWGA